MDDYGVNLTILKKVTIAENRQEWEFVWNSSCVPNAELTIFFDERHSTCWDIQKKGIGKPQFCLKLLLLLMVQKSG